MRRYTLLGIGVVVSISLCAASTAYGSASSYVSSQRTHTASPVALTQRPSNADRVQPRDLANIRYVAMGDSVAAGAGLPSLGGATEIDETCDRSAAAYPYLIAEALQTQVVQLACSGAKVDEGIYGPQMSKGVTIPAQLSTAFSDETPGLITMTIGANDIRWNQFIRQCYVAKCGFSIDNARTKMYRADLRIELTNMLYQINARSSGSPPRVLISGYYSPIDGTECLATNRMTADEVVWLNDQTQRMNQALRSVIALFNFVEFVPLDFQGHEICSTDPWVQGLDAAAPIHPTRTGQTAIAKSFLTALAK